MNETESLHFRLLLLEKQLQLSNERINELEGPLSKGKSVSTFPVFINKMCPLRKKDQLYDNYILLVILLTERDMIAPVIKISKELVRFMCQKKDGKIVTIIDYRLMNRSAQRQILLGGKEVWKLM